jgi:hypothetical protein
LSTFPVFSAFSGEYRILRCFPAPGTDKKGGNLLRKAVFQKKVIIITCFFKKPLDMLQSPYYICNVQRKKQQPGAKR